MRTGRSLAAAAVLAVALAACGGKQAEPVPEGDEQAGTANIGAYGCGACHAIPGIDGANGTVGPSLADFASHRYIAGRLPNSVDNAVRWIMHPHQIDPQTVMPDLGLSETQARDVVAYLYVH